MSFAEDIQAVGQPKQKPVDQVEQRIKDQRFADTIIELSKDVLEQQCRIDASVGKKSISGFLYPYLCQSVGENIPARWSVYFEEWRPEFFEKGYVYSHFGRTEFEFWAVEHRAHSFKDVIRQVDAWNGLGNQIPLLRLQPRSGILKGFYDNESMVIYIKQCLEYHLKRLGFERFHVGIQTIRDIQYTIKECSVTNRLSGRVDLKISDCNETGAISYDILVRIDW